MKRIAIICIVAFLSFFGCSDKKEKIKVKKSSNNVMGSVLLSVSSSGVNFLDFPVRIKSVLLISEHGDSHPLTTGFDANLANFNLNPQHILIDKTVPPANYTRLMINLEFTAESKVTYFDNSITKKPVTEYMLSQTGKKLGVDNKNFMINMPFMNGSLEVEADKVVHMNIGWDLNLSTEVYSSKDSTEDWVFEFKPIVKAHAVKENHTIDANGVFLGIENNAISIQSIFDASPAGLLTIDVRNVSNIYSGNDQSSLDNLQNIPLGSYIKLQSELKVVDGTIDIQARKVTFYDKKITTVKGIVIDIKDDTVDVLGTTISNANYLLQANDTYRLPSSVIKSSDKIYGLFSNIMINLATDEVEAMYRGGTRVQYPDSPILSGPENTIYTGKDAQVSAYNRDIFLITVTKDQVLSDGVKDKAQTVTLLANNYVTADETYEVELASGVTVNWIANGLWIGTGMIRVKNGKHVLLLEGVVENKDKTYVTYKYNHKYQGDSHLKFAWDDTNYHPTIKIDMQIDMDNIDFANQTAGIISKLVFSKKIKLKDSFGETIECSSLPTGLPNMISGNIDNKGGPRVVFELIQNHDEWDGSKAAYYATEETNFLASTKGLSGLAGDYFEGDKSSAEDFESNKKIIEWFKDNLDKEGKTLLVHSVTVMSDPVADGSTNKALENGGDCQFKPTYISIRWIREGTMLDEYKAVYNKKFRQDVGIATGLAAGGSLLLAGAIAGLVKVIKNKRMKNGSTTPSDLNASNMKYATTPVDAEQQNKLLSNIANSIDGGDVDLSKSSTKTSGTGTVDLSEMGVDSTIQSPLGKNTGSGSFNQPNLIDSKTLPGGGSRSTKTGKR